MPISVIIPTYQRLPLLHRALTSVATQTLPPQEVIVINDGGSSPVLEPFPTLNLRLIDLPTNRGAAQARNHGAELASTSHLAFLDDDDTWEPTYLARVEVVRQQGAEVSLAGFWKLKPGRPRSPEKIPPSNLDPNEWLVKNQGLRGSNLAISRTLFLKLGGFDTQLPTLHDMDFAIRLASYPDLCYQAILERLVNFHVHSGPRLSTPQSIANLAGLHGFWHKYQARMTVAQQAAFCARASEIWDVQLPGAPSL